VCRQEVEDPVGDLGIGSVDPIAVDLEEGQHRDEREPLSAVDEGLPLGESWASTAACIARSAFW
jgi:hypothetical protein